MLSFSILPPPVLQVLNHSTFVFVLEGTLKDHMAEVSFSLFLLL